MLPQIGLGPGLGNSQSGSALFATSFMEQPHKETNPKVTKLKKDELANSLDADEVAHYEPPHLHLSSLPYSLWLLNMI